MTLREARESIGWTRERLVQETGLSDGTINNIENGRPNGSSTMWAVAYLICDVLDIDINSIDWPNGLTDKGREPRTGGVYTVPRQEVIRYCPNPVCNSELPRHSDECSVCG